MTVENDSNYAIALTGVYTICCAVAGKLYVGISTDMYGRMRNHKAKLRSGKHICAPLQEDFLKYGEDAFAFSPLKECANIETAAISEKKILTHLRDKNRLYNSHIPAPIVFVQVREVKAHAEKGRYSFRPIIDLWPNAREFGNDIGTNPDHVRIMKRRDSIPAMYWLELVQRAHERGFEHVSFTHLAEIEAGQNGRLQYRKAAA